MSWKDEERLLPEMRRAERDHKLRDKIIEADRNGLNWDLFLEKARKNGISALLCFKLRKIQKDIPNIPPIDFLFGCDG